MSSSRGNVKVKGKDSPPKPDRPRKKREVTPDKPSTPSQEQDDGCSLARNVIWNEEIEKLQIKADELPKLWTPRPPTSEKNLVQISVQRMRKSSGKAAKHSLHVARPAPADAPLQTMDFSDCTGPRFDSSGDVILHSILGTYEEFYRQADQRGKLVSGMPKPQQDKENIAAVSVTHKPTHKQRSSSRQTEAKALANWDFRMKERKRQQEYISKILNKSPADLVMNQSDDFRQVQELRYLIDRTIPKVDYGKGYRTGSEFWQQQEQFGDDLTGVHTTLTQTQRGYPPPIEHVGLSKIVKKEKGCDQVAGHNVKVNHPWNKSEFFNYRNVQLQPYIHEIDPWRPEFDELQIIGSSKPTNASLAVECRTGQGHEKLSGEIHEEIPESQSEAAVAAVVATTTTTAAAVVVATTTTAAAASAEKEPVFGPSLLLSGQPARWTGDSWSLRDKTAIEVSVNFEAFTSDRITSYLELTNDGTTCIYYDWKRIAKENPFELVKNVMQRFYFNNQSGIILPSETLKLPFVFKSSSPGVYSEQWKLETRPVVCGGAALLVTLRGIALERDKFRSQRDALEKELLQRQARQVVTDLLYELVNGIRTPQRSCSPIDAYITEEEIFHRNNPNLVYNHQLVAELKKIHQKLHEDAGTLDVDVWSLCVDDLMESIMELDEENDKKEMLLHEMNLVYGKLTYMTQEPVKQDLHLIGHKILVETVDRIVSQSWLLRHAMGLSDRGQRSDLVDQGQSVGTPDREQSAAVNTNQTRISSSNDDNSSIKSGEGRKSQRMSDLSDKADAGKEKLKGNSKDIKNSKILSPKPDSKGKSPGSRKTPVKSLTPAPVTTLTSSPSTDDKVDEAGESSMNDNNTGSQVISKEKELEIIEKLYQEKFTVQVYNILGDMADRMDNIFSNISQATF